MKQQKEKNNKKSNKKIIAKILIFASILGVTATGVALSKGDNIISDIKDKIFDMVDNKIAEKYPSLQAPKNVKLDIDNNTISWDKVDNATFYDVYLKDANGQEIYLKVDEEIDKDGINYNGANYARTSKCSLNIRDFRKILFNLGYKDGDELNFIVYGYNEAAENVGKILFPGQSYVERNQYKSPAGVLNYVVENQNNYFRNRVSQQMDENIRMIFNSYLVQNSKNDIFYSGFHKQINFLDKDYDKIQNLNYSVDIEENGVIRLTGTMDLYNEFNYYIKNEKNYWEKEIRGLYRPVYFDFSIDDKEVVSIFKNIENNKDNFKNGILVEDLNLLLTKRWYVQETIFGYERLDPVHFTGNNTFKYIDGLGIKHNNTSELDRQFNGANFYEGLDEFVQENLPIDCATGLINLFHPNINIDKILYLNNGNIRKEDGKILFDVNAYVKTIEGDYVEAKFTIRSWKEDKSIEWHCNEVNETLKDDKQSIIYRTVSESINIFNTQTNSFLQEVQNYKNISNSGTLEQNDGVGFDNLK